MSAASEARAARAVRLFDARRTAPPADYWHDDEALCKAARVQARVDMTYEDHFELVLEAMASDPAARRLAKRLCDQVNRDFVLCQDEFIAAAARDLVMHMKVVAAGIAKEELQR